mmetsp:Transcript_61790/g.93318  ORF Transcript_61790/g.93318 Transcript_61790/m.93318 type:complete len:261 (-) Transcript_61790:14-796(-)
MMTTTMTMMMMMLFLAFCFLLLTPTGSFSTMPPPPSLSTSTTKTISSSLLHMGGYYSEPKEDNSSSMIYNNSNTHMIFGVRCVEDIIYCSPTTNTSFVTNLRPINDDENDSNTTSNNLTRETDTDPRAQQRLVAYLMTPDEQQDVYAKPVLKGARVVQIGIGAVALACACYGDCESIVVVDDDEMRLKIYRHAYDLLVLKEKNTNDNDGTTPCPLETMFLEPKDALPKADVIILSTEDEEWIAAALDSNRTRTCLFEGAY